MKKWIIKNTKADIGKLSEELGIDKLVCKVISNRGMTERGELERFLRAGISELSSPWDMMDMEEAVSIISDAVASDKKIRVVGDYDQDGISSSVILCKGLSKIGADVDYDIPERTLDGYGINERIVKAAHSDDIDLIITCDNGIAAGEAVDCAKELGMDIIVTDHHDVPFVEVEGEKDYKMPNADAVLNPKRPDCNYPFDGICGAGVAFKLVQALYEKHGVEAHELGELYEFLALATVCDVMDLVEENRIFVREGLERIGNTENIGMKALIEETKLSEKTIGTYHLGFILGPSINASGRLETAKTAVDLFLTEDIGEAEEKAKTLNRLNEERKSMTQDGIDRLTDKIESSGIDSDKVIVAIDRDVPESVAGIIAGRIREKYNRPSIVVTSSKEDGVLKASGRSIEEYNMFEELSKNSELFLKFGGHPMAAGFSIQEENIDELGYRLNRDAPLSEEDFVPKIYLDAHLPLEGLSLKTPEILEILEPFGKGNHRPLFGDRGLNIKKLDILGKNYRVFKMRVEKSGSEVEAIYFGDVDEMKGYFEKKFGADEVENAFAGRDNTMKIDVVYYPSINEFNGRRSLQIVVQDYR